jgi:hypothetical protein
MDIIPFSFQPENDNSLISIPYGFIKEDYRSRLIFFAEQKRKITKMAEIIL